jgi:N-methylhydantoinase B
VKASFLMDHGRVGPPGLLDGSPGAVNEILVSQGGAIAKGEGYMLAPGDWIAVKTPGGGGYGPAVVWTGPK